MKKIILALFMLVFLTGCTPVQKMNIEDIVNDRISKDIRLTNEHRAGYKYYLHKGMNINDKSSYNEKIKSGNYTYYLYVDVVSYYNKVIDKFESKDDVYYSSSIDYQEKFGYLEIKNIKDDKYIIEIMYNYAKIEVIVNEDDINVAVSNAINVLSSIEYNDTMINKLIGEETSSFNELEYNIFETTNDSTYLEFVNDEDSEQVEEEIHDTDLVN